MIIIWIRLGQFFTDFLYNVFCFCLCRCIDFLFKRSFCCGKIIHFVLCFFFRFLCATSSQHTDYQKKESCHPHFFHASASLRDIRQRNSYRKRCSFMFFTFYFNCTSMHYNCTSCNGKPKTRSADFSGM